MRELRIDLTGSRKPLNRFFNFCVGAGRAGEMMRAQALDQLSVLQECCHFRYLRFHGLLSDEMAVCAKGEDGRLLFNWQYIDLVFDEMLKRGIRPLVELGFMPDCMKSLPAALPASVLNAMCWAFCWMRSVCTRTCGSRK